MLFTKEAIQEKLKTIPRLQLVDRDGISWYEDAQGTQFRRVTNLLQLLKDPSLANWKMNESHRYILEHADRASTLEGLAELIIEAKRVPQQIFENAGDIGSRIHGYRQRIFEDYIAGKIVKVPYTKYIPDDEHDIRSVSAMRALEKFVRDTDYMPIATEVRLYSKKWGIAGTCDDIGFLGGEFGDLVLLDLKTSNYHKSSYHCQTVAYASMLQELTGIKVKKIIILKLSKTDGTYSIEEVKQPSRIRPIIPALMKISEVMDFIDNNRKNNKEIITI